MQYSINLVKKGHCNGEIVWVCVANEHRHIQPMQCVIVPRTEYKGVVPFSESVLVQLRNGQRTNNFILLIDEKWHTLKVFLDEKSCKRHYRRMTIETG